MPFCNLDNIIRTTRAPEVENMQSLLQDYNWRLDKIAIFPRSGKHNFHMIIVYITAYW